ncbi:ATP-binding protein [Rhodobaculum claviforme]|uniref:histidine kinase n=1 Tax=Rhodobaculum claviforme TaxID=1549854 RepID=A0A934TKA4_9RHOB|nr:ATP-binding protein [Rhodobaculum claviforme]MBK5926613.1 two-component sensor histidine kinase [Rhodobaculum claviforme]
MARRALKTFLPRGLYGRAALILLLPILTLQLVVSVVFIQRHYDGVAEQMTRNISGSLAYLLREVEQAPDRAAARRTLAGLVAPLGLQGRLPTDAVPPDVDRRALDDLTGRAVIATLRADLPGVLAVDLVSGRREVGLWLETAHGPMQVTMERRRVSASNPHQLLVIVIVTGLLMAAIAYVFLRNQLRPITQLAAAAEAFGKGQTLPYRPRGATEVRAAGQAFLAMRDRIERQIEQRTLMLSAVSHDLRTPLTRLRLGLALLGEGPDIDALTGDVEDMERLVDAFLAYASGAATDEVVPTDLSGLAQAALERAARAGLSVEAVGMTRPLVVALRPLLMARALDNLIGNAARYGSRCRVTLRCAPGACRIVVEDDGPGIPRDQRAEAVQPFARLDAARNRDRQPGGGAGVGLGLAIVADVLRGHGGQLLLDDSPELGGLRVQMVLPR